MSIKNKNIEFVGVILKIGGKEKIIEKDKLTFHGWEQECDTCGSHGGVYLEFHDDSNTWKKIKLDSF